jgi:uncharacterized protein YcbX
MQVAAIRRYPVKGMAGESLGVATIDARGLAWDRWYAVVDEQGRFASGKDSRRFRRRDAVFGYAAQAGPHGVTVTRDGRTWAAESVELAGHLTEDMGDPVRVLTEGRVPHQDDGGVSLVGTASLRWCAERWGDEADPRRLRVNLVVATDEPFVEDTWVGRMLTLGSARLHVAAPTPRCRMLDIEQDGVRPTARWMRPLALARDLDLGVYLDVARPGEVVVGDQLRLHRGALPS